jgi:hypothetical protein
MINRFPIKKAVFYLGVPPLLRKLHNEVRLSALAFLFA